MRRCAETGVAWTKTAIQCDGRMSAASEVVREGRLKPAMPFVPRRRGPSRRRGRDGGDSQISNKGVRNQLACRNPCQHLVAWVRRARERLPKAVSVIG